LGLTIVVNPDSEFVDLAHGVGCEIFVDVQVQQVQVSQELVALFTHARLGI